ncbi:MAG: aminotransferase class I/II-fold pyridoxal phosphate-dependent enzyme, partial [Spirochaetales bacterium]|nr:aminotransferase class I/II-fold pyridoxal phosphate-dependent enzyme [Spirochaetales bacterium]
MSLPGNSRFDRIINRRDTRSAKWNLSSISTDRADILPMWVADMDFPAAPEILAALDDVTRHGIFGYLDSGKELKDLYISWLLDRQGIRIETPWLLPASGVLAALALSIQELTSPGDAIIYQPPVYYPFGPTIEMNGRRAVENPLQEVNGQYSFDFANLRKAASEGAKALLLCNPHNPVGRVWRRDELEELTAVCGEFGLLILSDDIHSDITMPGNTHTPVF